MEFDLSGWSCGMTCRDSHSRENHQGFFQCHERHSKQKWALLMREAALPPVVSWHAPTLLKRWAGVTVDCLMCYRHMPFTPIRCFPSQLFWKINGITISFKAHRLLQLGSFLLLCWQLLSMKKADCTSCWAPPCSGHKKLVANGVSIKAQWLIFSCDIMETKRFYICRIYSHIQLVKCP